MTRLRFWWLYWSGCCAFCGQGFRAHKPTELSAVLGSQLAHNWCRQRRVPRITLHEADGFSARVEPREVEPSENWTQRR